MASPKQTGRPQLHGCCVTTVVAAEANKDPRAAATDAVAKAARRPRTKETLEPTATDLSAKS